MRSWSICTNLVTYGYALSALFFASAVYIVICFLPFKWLNKVLIGHILTFKEMIGVLLLIYSLVIAICGLIYFNNSCGYMSLMLKIYLYVFWFTFGLVYLAILYFFLDP